jgi:DNA-binding transcriptional MerR regulator
MDSEFYSIKEVAQIFSVNEVTIRRAIRKGFIIAIRIGDYPKSPYRVSKKLIEAIHQSIIQKLSSKAQKP